MFTNKLSPNNKNINIDITTFLLRVRLKRLFLPPGFSCRRWPPLTPSSVHHSHGCPSFRRPVALRSIPRFDEQFICARWRVRFLYILLNDEICTNRSVFGRRKPGDYLATDATIYTPAVGTSVSIEMSFSFFLRSIQRNLATTKSSTSLWTALVQTFVKQLPELTSLLKRKLNSWRPA